MKCPKCQSDNPDTQKFCGECATPLPSSKEIPVTETLETPTEELTTGSTFAGRYQIIEELGKGGMGKVYRVLDKELKEEVALKLIRPEIASDKKTLERFRNELKLARKISHKNVGRMYELMEEKGTRYITMEYVRGEDLKRLIRKISQLSAGQAIPIAKQICEGLVEAHRLGVVHRDLKPQNIMVDEEGNARILDFGIARSLKAKGITGAGVIIGTPEYMSPEQAEVKEVDRRSDIYSLGVILYEMVTGRVPFEGETPLGIAMKHKSEAPPDPRESNAQIPEELGRVILRCMEKDKEKRYQSAGEVRSELIMMEKGIPAAERVIPKRKPITSKEITVTFGLKKLYIPVLVVIALTIIAVIILQLIPRKEAVSVLPSKPSIVVLPFENLGLPEDEYFAAGITDEIMARLTGIGELRIIARNSALQYKETSKTIEQIGEELEVDYILSGTIRWQKTTERPSRVRVTPTLIKATDSTHIWANIYDESIAGIFQVQSDIAKQVVEALGIALLEPERRILEAKPTDNLEAYEYYLRANDYFNRGRDNTQYIIISIEMYEKAIKLDAKFVHAFAMLSRAQSTMYWYHWDRSEERVAKAKQAVERALEIDPDLPEAHLALGHYYYHCKLDYGRALEHFYIAQEKQPKNSEIWEFIGYVNRRQGKLNQAVSSLKRALEIDPRSSLIASNLGETLALMRKYKEAERYYNKALSLHPDYLRVYSWKARLYLNSAGNIVKAREVLEEASESVISIDEHLIIYLWVLIEIFDGNYQKALDRLSLVSVEAFYTQFYFIPKALFYAQIYGLMNKKQLEQEYYDSARIYLEAKINEQPDDSRLHSALGIAYAGLGLKERAIQEAKKAVELLPVSKEAYRGSFRELDLAQVYVMVGEHEKAMDKIKYLLSIPGEMSIPLLKINPTWAPLLLHPRFKKLLE